MSLFAVNNQKPPKPWKIISWFGPSSSGLGDNNTNLVSKPKKIITRHNQRKKLLTNKKKGNQMADVSNAQIIELIEELIELAIKNPSYLKQVDTYIKLNDTRSSNLDSEIIVRTDYEIIYYMPDKCFIQCHIRYVEFIGGKLKHVGFIDEVVNYNSVYDGEEKSKNISIKKLQHQQIYLSKKSTQWLKNANKKIIDMYKNTL